MSQSPPLNQRPVSDLKGAGPQTVERLSRLHIQSIQDLLFHLPMRYQNRTTITPIGALKPGLEVVIEGTILASDTVMGRRRSLLCRLGDDTGITSLRFFYFSNAQKKNLQQGYKIRCFGEVRRGSSGLELYHPEYQLIHKKGDADLSDNLTPVYPLTEGISQNKLRQLITQAVSLLKNNEPLPNLLPENCVAGEKQTDITAILAFLHAPPARQISDKEVRMLEQQCHPFQQRLALEELTAHQLSLLQLRQKVRSQKATPLTTGKTLTHQFLEQLPFDLTNAQQRVLAEIKTDLADSTPMLRLIQGDVGAGKTVVAAIAALQAIASHQQVALMAPTEILAEQHLRSFTAWMSTLNINIAWLTGKQSVKTRQSQQQLLDSGEAQIAIGTHALFQKGVSFRNLGLIIIDEQHRFGVHQRLALLEKGSSSGLTPHQLIMTATPIPRTLAMCAYADLDCSVIDELPPGRKPVETVLISDQRRSQVIERVRNACETGTQVYWVCTLIEESEVLQCQAAEATEEQLGLALPNISIGLIHGRLSSDVKADLMNRFKSGEIQLLVATTVIEVGVDVANATLMIIENPERLGLAQLHQLRGRVGRGESQSYCVLMYSAPLSENSRQRLAIMRETNDGFRIAEKDLELRGPGEVLGTRQTGLTTLKIADLERDRHLIPEAQNCAKSIVNCSPGHIKPLINRWLANQQAYGQV